MSRFILFALAALAAPIVAHDPPALAQPAPAQLAPAQRAQLVQLLSYDCGVRETLDAFRAGLLAIGSPAQPLLLQVLREGAPREQRAAEERRLGKTHAELQAMVRRPDPELRSVVEGAVLPERGAFIADGLRRLDAKYRDNAARGLGTIGGADAIGPLQQAGQANPDIAGLTTLATAEISTRVRPN